MQQHLFTTSQSLWTNKIENAKHANKSWWAISWGSIHMKQLNIRQIAEKKKMRINTERNQQALILFEEFVNIYAEILWFFFCLSYLVLVKFGGWAWATFKCLEKKKQKNNNIFRHAYWFQDLLSSFSTCDCSY